MPNKLLGQHWLTDRSVLTKITDHADIQPDETVLEIGPGLGTLTSKLLARAQKVVAVEYDRELARKLPAQFPGKQLEVINHDILQFDLTSLPADYKVVANVPYYITSKIIELLVRSDNPPRRAVLLVQREVAQRIAARPGEMSLLALSAQVYTETSLGITVGRQFFTPPPKVDSQVVVLDWRKNPLIPSEDEKAFWRVARAGFSSRRKKLRSSIAAGLAIDKSSAEAMLRHANINPNARAQDLSLADWARLAKDAV